MVQERRVRGSTVPTVPGQELPNVFGDIANTGREIEQSQGEMKFKYVPGGREGSFLPTLVKR